MSNVQLGDVREFGGHKYVATHRTPAGLVVWSPIPAGMTADDLGRRFVGAVITTDERASA